MLSLAILAAAAAGVAPPPMSNHVVISSAWFRSLPANLPSGGYFQARNSGQMTATLVGVDSPACAMLMLHKSEHKNGIDTMTDVPSIDIAPGETVSFAPGSYHLMCTDPGPTMKPGKSVPVSLRFLDGSVANATFAVKTASGQ